MTDLARDATPPWANFAGIFGGLFCGYVGVAAPIPVLPLYVRDAFATNDLAVGMAVMATAMTALLSRPIAGALADRHGYRLIMQIGALLVALGGVLYFAPLGLMGLVGARLIVGAGEAALFTAGAVWVVSLTPHNRRGQLIGLYGVSMWGGISLGTLAGAALLPFGYKAVWLFSAAAPVVGLVLVSAVPAPAAVPSAPGGHRLFLRPALMPGLALGLAAAGYAAVATFAVLHLKARGIESGVVVLSVFSVVYAGTRLIIGHLPDKYGPRRVASVSGVGEAVGLMIIAVAPTLWVAVVGSVIMGIGFSLLHPSLALMVMNLVDKSRQGAALGAYTAFWDLGLGVWGPLTGVIAMALGYPPVFVFGALCAVAAVAVTRLVSQPALHTSGEFLTRS